MNKIELNQQEFKIKVIFRIKNRLGIMNLDQPRIYCLGKEMLT